MAVNTEDLSGDGHTYLLYNVEGMLSETNGDPHGKSLRPVVGGMHCYITSEAAI